jgi:NAD(P)-dependent dehydrogenase (short-subunit alcohol dehydrogenase family)
MGLLQHKNIAVVGGTSGIGLAATQAFLREGARVYIMGRAESLDAAREVLGERAVVRAGDARHEADVTAWLDAVPGELHGLYHVAGGSGRRQGDGALHELTEEGWAFTLELNLTSLMLSNRAAIRRFLRQGSGGAILNLGSVLGCAPSRAYFASHAYAAAKGAAIGFTKSVAAYYAPQNIRVNLLMPGLVHSPMSQRATGDEAIVAFTRTKQPLDGGRVGLPEDLDAAAVYFLSDGSRFATGQTLAVDGGWMLSDGQL